MWLLAWQCDCTPQAAQGTKRGADPLCRFLQGWQRYNTPLLDFNLTFDTHNLSRLQAAMAAEERQHLPMSLDPLTWDTYMSQYMTAVQRIFLKQAV